MKIVQAIKELQSILKEHGNLNLKFHAGENNYPNENPKFDLWYSEMGRQGNVEFAYVCKGYNNNDGGCETNI